MNFSRTFAAMSNVMAEAQVESEQAFDEIDKSFANGVSYTNNNGHVVLTGPVKSLRINDDVIPVPPKR